MTYYVSSGTLNLTKPKPICLSSVCNVRAPTHAIEIFGNVFTPFGSLRWAFIEFEVKFYGDSPRGTSLLGVLNRTGVAKYSDFGRLLDYISETVQERR